MLPGGIDLDLFHPGQRGDAPWPALFTARRLVPRTGVGELVAAMPAILAAFPHATLSIAGTGELEASLRSQISRLGLSFSHHAARPSGRGRTRTPIPTGRPCGAADPGTRGIRTYDSRGTRMRDAGSRDPCGGDAGVARADRSVTRLGGHSTRPDRRGSARPPTRPCAPRTACRLEPATRRPEDGLASSRPTSHRDLRVARGTRVNGVPRRMQLAVRSAGRLLSRRHLVRSRR